MISNEQVLKTFQKHLMDALRIVAEKERSGHFYFLLGKEGDTGKIANSKCWMLDSKKGRIETQSWVLKPNVLASTALDELIDDNSKVKISMTCQMAVQLAYYVAILRACRELSTPSSLFDDIFLPQNFILRDFITSAGAPFLPAINSIACITEYSDIKLHPLFPFIKIKDLKNNSIKQKIENKTLQIGDIFVFNNFYDYAQLANLVDNNGFAMPSSRLVMTVCTSIEGNEAYFTAFGYKGESKTTIKIAEALVSDYNQLQRFFSQIVGKTKEELLKSPGFYASGGHESFVGDILVAIINYPEQTLSSLKKLNNSLREEITELRKIELAENSFMEAEKLYPLSSKAYKEERFNDARVYYIKVLFHLHNGVFDLVKNDSVSSGQHIINIITNHYNLARCYENLNDFASAAYHFELCLKLGELFRQEINQKHQKKFKETFSKAYGVDLSGFEIQDAQIASLSTLNIQLPSSPAPKQCNVGLSSLYNF